MSGFKRRGGGPRKPVAPAGLKLPKIKPGDEDAGSSSDGGGGGGGGGPGEGRGSPQSAGQAAAAEEVAQQRARLRQSKANKGKRKKKKDAYANNPLGAVRPTKFKAAVYKKPRPKAATKAGRGLTDKHGQFRMFREPKRSMEQLQEVKANAMATIRSMGALAVAGDDGKVRREAAEAALKKVMQSVKESRDVEELRSGIKTAVVAGLTERNRVLLAAQSQLQGLILENLLRRKMAECEKSRDAAELRKAVIASVKGGLSKGTPVYMEAVELLATLEQEAHRVREALERLEAATDAAMGDKHVPKLEAALKAALALGVPQAHESVKEARRKLDHLRAAARLRAAALAKLQAATEEARRTRVQGELPVVIRSCVDLSVPEGKGTPVWEARALLAELHVEEGNREALAAALAAATEKARTVLQNEVKRPKGKAKMRLARSIVGDALGRVHGKLPNDHSGVVAATEVENAANARLQAVAESEARLAAWLSNDDDAAAPIDAAEINARAEEALDEHVPDDGSSKVMQWARRSVELLADVRARLIDEGLKGSIAAAEGCLARVRGDEPNPSVFARDDNILLQVATLQDALQAAREALVGAVAAHAEWLGADESVTAAVPGLSAAQKRRLTATEVAPLLAAAAALHQTAAHSDSAGSTSTAPAPAPAPAPSPAPASGDGDKAAHEVEGGEGAGAGDIAKAPASAEASAKEKGGEGAGQKPGGEGGKKGSNDNAALARAGQELECYLELYVAVLEQRDHLQGLKTAADPHAAALAIDTSALEGCLAAAAAALQAPHCKAAFYVEEARNVLRQIDDAKQEAKKHAAVGTARAELRAAVVACSQDHDVRALQTALSHALFAGLPEDSVEITCAKRLKDELFPQLAQHIATAAALRSAWGPDHAESLEWLETAVAQLDAAAAMRREQERRSAAPGGLDAGALSTDTLCVVPNDEQASALDQAAALAAELRTAIEAVYRGYERAVLKLERDLSAAINTAKEQQVSKPLKEAAAVAEAGVVPPPTTSNLARFNDRASIADATTRLYTAMKDVSGVIMLIGAQAEAAINVACDDAEDDASAIDSLAAALTKHTQNGNLDDSSKAVKRASSLLAKLRAAAAALSALVKRLMGVTEQVLVSRDAGALRDAIAKAIYGGLAEDHDAVLAAKQLVAEIDEQERQRLLEEKRRMAAEAVLQGVIDDVRKSEDLAVLRDGIAEALHVLKGNNTVVRAAHALITDIESRLEALQDAIAHLRAETARCGRDHHEPAPLEAAVAAAAAAGLLVDESDDVASARTLIDELLPAHEARVYAVHTAVADWGGSDHDQHAASLGWMGAAIETLDNAEEGRMEQVKRGGKPGLDVAAAAEAMSPDTVCVLPTSKEDELLDNGKALAKELRAAVDALHTRHAAELEKLAQSVVTATAAARELGATKSLLDAIATAQAGVPGAREENLEALRRRPAVAEAEVALHDRIAEAQVAVGEIIKGAEARLDAASDAAEADAANLDGLEAALAELLDNATLTEKSAAVVRARAVIAAIRAANMQLGELAAHLAEVTASVRESREAGALRSTLATSLERGLKEDHEAVTAAKALLAELDAEATARAAAEAALQQVVDDVTSSRAAEPLQAGVEEARAVLSEDNAVVEKAKLLLAEIAAERADAAAALAAAAERLRAATDAARESRDAEPLKSAIVAAEGSGVAADAPEMTAAKALLSELVAAEEARLAAEAALQQVVGAVTASRDAEALEAGVAAAREVLPDDNTVVKKANALLEEIRGERDVAAAALAAAKERLRGATEGVRESKDVALLKAEIQVATDSQVPGDAAEMAAAKALLSELDAAEEARLAAEAVLQKVVDEVTASRDAAVLEAAVATAREVLPEDNAVMGSANALLAEIAAEEQALRDARARLKAATDAVRESYETAHLKAEVGVALESRVPEDSAEVVEARELVASIVAELSARLAAATAHAAGYHDIATLEGELDYCGHVLRTEGEAEQAVVAEAEARLAALRERSHAMAVRVQQRARVFLAKKTAAELRRQRDDDLNDIFGELGSAMAALVETGFEHKEREAGEEGEPGAAELFLKDNVEFKHIYEDPETTAAAEKLAVLVQKHTRRRQAQQAYKEYADYHLQRWDADTAAWYSKSQFVDFYGGEEEWNRALLAKPPEQQQQQDAGKVVGPGAEGEVVAGAGAAGEGEGEEAATAEDHGDLPPVADAEAADAEAADAE